MLKKSMSFPSIYFVVSTVWQLIFNKEIEWLDNIMVCFIMYLFILFHEWSKTPYKWGKDEQ